MTSTNNTGGQPMDDDDVLTVQVCYLDLALLDARARALHGHDLRPERLGTAAAVQVVTSFMFECAQTRPHATVAEGDRVVADSSADGLAATVGALASFARDHGPHRPLVVLVKPTLLERLRGHRTLRLHWAPTTDQEA